MNRHFIDYARFPAEALGKRIEPELPAKPEPKWEPSGTPGYERRIVNGKVETRPIRLDPVPATPATPLVAPTEWQDGAPPCPGWYEILVDGLDGERYAYYFGGYNHSCWSLFGKRHLCCQSDIDCGPVHSTRDIQWRGHRLTGADWPEPV